MSIFNNKTKLSDEPVIRTQQVIQNKNYQDYIFNNPRNDPRNDHNLSSAINIAVQQPGMMCCGESKGTNIYNLNAALDNTQHVTKFFSKSSEQHVYRPYLTIPYLGSGASNITAETSLRYGDNTLLSKDYIRESFTRKEAHDYNSALTPSPIPTEGGVSPNWIRGGTHTRCTYKNTNTK